MAAISTLTAGSRAASSPQSSTSEPSTARPAVPLTRVADSKRTQSPGSPLAPGSSLAPCSPLSSAGGSGSCSCSSSSSRACWSVPTACRLSSPSA
eukprot:7390635-Prymnesium_polylepis.2